VELAKQFGSDETSSFVNGILDAIAKSEPREANLPVLIPDDHSPLNWKKGAGLVRKSRTSSLDLETDPDHALFDGKIDAIAAACYSNERPLQDWPASSTGDSRA